MKFALFIRRLIGILRTALQPTCTALYTLKAYPW